MSLTFLDGVKLIFELGVSGDFRHFVLLVEVNLRNTCNRLENIPPRWIRISGSP